MKRSKACQNLTGFPEIGKQVVGSAPDADCFVAFHGNPIHVNCIVPAFDNAMLFTSTNIWARQDRDASFNFKAFYATHLDTPAATSTFACVHYGYPFLVHGSLVSVTYFTMIVPFIHGCGAH